MGRSRDWRRNPAKRAVFPHWTSKDASPTRPSEERRGFNPLFGGYLSGELVFSAVFASLDAMGRLFHLERRGAVDGQVRFELLETLLAEALDLRQLLDAREGMLFPVCDDRQGAALLHSRKHLQLLLSSLVQVHHAAHRRRRLARRLRCDRRQNKGQSQPNSLPCLTDHQ